jgi:hypothetical protein
MSFTCWGERGQDGTSAAVAFHKETQRETEREEHRERLWRTIIYMLTVTQERFRGLAAGDRGSGGEPEAEARERKRNSSSFPLSLFTLYGSHRLYRSTWKQGRVREKGRESTSVRAQWEFVFPTDQKRNKIENIPFSSPHPPSLSLV